MSTPRQPSFIGKRRKKSLTALAIAAFLSLAAPSPAPAQSAEETTFVLALLRGMKQLSDRFNREVCGDS
jgi:hypothetical protein